MKASDGWTKIRLRLMTTLAMALFLVLTETATAQSAEDVTTTRIISLVPSVTETIFHLGADEMLTAVSDFCNWPEEAKDKRRVGGFLNPRLEEIISLKPDVVVLLNSQSELAGKLERLRIAAVMVRTDSLEDVFESIKTAGSVSGRVAASEKLVEEIKSKLENIRRRSRNDESGLTSVLIIVGRQPSTLQNMYAAGPASYLGELLEFAGGKNAAPEGARPYPAVTKEQVLAADPQLIIDTSLGEAGQNPDVLREHKSAWQKLPLLRAVRDRHVEYVTDPHLTIPGPAVVITAEKFFGLLHANSDGQR